MKNHHFQWANQLYIVIFNSYVRLPEGMLRSSILHSTTRSHPWTLSSWLHYTREQQDHPRCSGAVVKVHPIRQNMVVECNEWIWIIQFLFFLFGYVLFNLHSSVLATVQLAVQHVYARGRRGKWENSGSRIMLELKWVEHASKVQTTYPDFSSFRMEKPFHAFPIFQWTVFMDETEANFSHRSRPVWTHVSRMKNLLRREACTPCVHAGCCLYAVL